MKSRNPFSDERPQGRASKVLSRRRFLEKAGFAAAAFQLAPRAVVAGAPGTAPNEKLRIACIGVGGRGWSDLHAVAGEDIVALCDVDERRAARAFQAFPRAKVYHDFRKMLDDMDSAIDAVVVATPDHTHSVAGMAAIEHNKHLYCEKPLAHSIHEVRALHAAAKKHRVVTQLGNQGHSFDTMRTFCEWVWDGAIGNVHTVHAFCVSNYSRIQDLPSLARRYDIPAGLDWDLWLGPAQKRPYNPVFLPGIWRGWTPFGTGVIGDWTCHVVDPVFWALDLGAPSSVRAEAKHYDPKQDALTFPAGSRVTYEFPAKGKRGPVTLIWYDGEEKPPRPADLEADDRLPGIGAVVVGDKASIVYGSHGAGHLRIIPDAKMEAYRKPPPTLPRAKEHHADWLNAIRQGTRAGSDFDYGAPLTEIALLGIIAIHLLGTRLEWDAEAGRFPHHSEANRYLHPPFRAGWSLGQG